VRWHLPVFSGFFRIAAAAFIGGVAGLISACVPPASGPTGEVAIDERERPYGSPEQVLDHLLCYQLDDHFPPNALPVITLVDQFDTWRDWLLMDDVLCNPVDKHPPAGPGAYRKHGEAHLVCYVNWPPADTGDRVVIANQFTRFLNSPKNLTLLREYSLCVPSTKARAPRKPENFANLPLDHFKCYLVAPLLPVPFLPPPVTRVMLQDQFVGPAPFAVSLLPELLCAPTDKMVPGKPPIFRRNPGAHLVCYLLIDPPPVKLPQVLIRNQIEPQGPKVQPLRPWALCLPSTKQLLPPPGKKPEG
jgi:hypothetical protein